MSVPPPHKAPRPYTVILVSLMMIVILVGAIVLVVIQKLQVATSDTQVTADAHRPTLIPTATTAPTIAPPTAAPTVAPATQAPLFSSTPTETISTDCASSLLPATWLDQKSTTQLLALFKSVSGTSSVIVQVYNAGEACYVGSDLSAASYRPTQTDVTLIVSVDAAVLKPDELLDERVGELTLRLVQLLPDQQSGIVEIVFTDGARSYSLRFTRAQLARALGANLSHPALLQALGGLN